MNRFSVLALTAALLALAACSDSDDKQTPVPQTQSAAPTPAPAQQPATPAGHQLNPAQQAALAAAQSMPKQGTVLEMMHAAGYTYMQVDTGAEKPIWIAANMMRVQPKDKVQWGDAAVMRNFASKSLHRTFDEILFVSNASVVQ